MTRFFFRESFASLPSLNSPYTRRRRMAERAGGNVIGRVTSRGEFVPRAGSATDRGSGSGPTSYGDAAYARGGGRPVTHAPAERAPGGASGDSSLHRKHTPSEYLALQALRGQGGNGSAPRGEGRIIGVYTVLPLVTQGRVQLPMCCIATLCQHQRPTVLQLCVLRPTDCPAAARGVRTARART